MNDDENIDKRIQTLKNRVLEHDEHHIFCQILNDPLFLIFIEEKLDYLERWDFDLTNATLYHQQLELLKSDIYAIYKRFEIAKEGIDYDLECNLEHIEQNVEKPAY